MEGKNCGYVFFKDDFSIVEDNQEFSDNMNIEQSKRQQKSQRIVQLK